MKKVLSLILFFISVLLVSCNPSKKDLNITLDGEGGFDYYITNGVKEYSLHLFQSQYSIFPILNGEKLYSTWKEEFGMQIGDMTKEGWIFLINRESYNYLIMENDEKGISAEETFFKLNEEFQKILKKLDNENPPRNIKTMEEFMNWFYDNSKVKDIISKENKTGIEIDYYFYAKNLSFVDNEEIAQIVGNKFVGYDFSKLE